MLIVVMDINYFCSLVLLTCLVLYVEWKVIVQYLNSLSCGLSICNGYLSQWVHQRVKPQPQKRYLYDRSKEITQLIETILDREWSKENDEGERNYS